MKYLLTGASGFLGRHILAALPKGAVVTMGRGPENAIECDLASSVPDLPPVDVVIHSAGKAHMVPKTQEEGEEFFRVNLQGSKNLLQALEDSRALPRQLVFISTVSVYDRESGEMISENHPLEGKSPYALSKIEAEREMERWGKKNGVPVLILRLPLIVGDSAPGNLGRMIRGIQTGRYASIARGKARKSMVLAEDVAELIARVGGQRGVYHLTDGYHPSFNELETAIAAQLHTRIKLKLPIAVAKVLAKIGDLLPFFPVNSRLVDKMSLDLTFDDSRAQRELSWAPRRVLDFRFIDIKGQQANQ